MDKSFACLLDTQGGVVTASQARDHFTRRQLEAQVKFGQLEWLWRGVYSRPDPDLAVKLRGVDLMAGETVAACLGTAAVLYGFDTEDTDNVHVLNPEGHQLRSAAGLIIHRREGAPLIDLGGRPMTAAAWTAIEVARGLPRPRALATLDAALRSGICSRADLRLAAKRQAGRRGIVAVRNLVELADGAAESPMESEARLAMLDGGLPPPVLQYEIIDADGRLWRVDFAWPSAKVAAEYESDQWHNNPTALRHDRIRNGALQEIAWTVVPIVGEDVRYRPSSMCRRIETQLNRNQAAA